MNLALPEGRDVVQQEQWSWAVLVVTAARDRGETLPLELFDREARRVLGSLMYELAQIPAAWTERILQTGEGENA